MNNRTLTDSAYAELVSLYQGQEINRVLEKVELHLEDRILDPRLLTLKGICEQQRGNLKGAAEAFSRAIELDPNHTDAFVNLGLVKKILGDTTSAIALYKRALSLNPQEINALNNLGNLYLHLHDPKAGLTVLKKGVSLYPNSKELLSNLGLAYKLLSNFDRAAEYLTRAIKLGAATSNVLLNLGIVLEQLTRVSEAINCYEKIPLGDSLGQMALARRATLYAASFDFISLRKIRPFMRDLGTGSRLVTPFSMLYFDDHPKRQFQRATNYWNSKFLAESRNDVILCKKGKSAGIIKIGYVSGEFHTHAVSQLTQRLFELHDRQYFHISGYSLTEPSQDRLRDKLVNSFDEFRSVGSMSDSEVSEIIAKDAIDILVDLSGYTKHGRPGIFATRPAPIQINYLGYPGTLGSDTYDYIVADTHLISNDEEKFYSEKIIYMPITYQSCNDKRFKPDRSLARVEYGFDDRQIILSGFNNILKISEETMSTWFSILKRYPQTLLWLTTNSREARDNISNLSQQFNINSNQILFSDYCDYESYLTRLAASDIFLDTPIFNAGSTANDCLWCGLPIVAMEGRSYQSRMSSSMLKSLSLEYMIVANLDEYAEVIADLIDCPTKLAYIRAQLLGKRDSHPFFDSSYFTKKLEQAYTSIYKISIENERPRNIAVSRY